MPKVQEVEVEVIAALQELGETPDFDQIGLTSQWAAMVKRHVELTEAIQELEAKREPLRDEIKLQLVTSGAKKVKVGDVSVQLIDATRRTIERQRLLTALMKFCPKLPATIITKIIAAATIVHNVTSLRIAPPKAAESVKVAGNVRAIKK